MLYIVPTPIGNLQDITLRALDALKSADYILCEDTRQTGKLLSAYGISVKTLRYNENDPSALSRLVGLLKSGKNCALVSDAGTPCVSDPGWRLVKAAREEGVKVTALPGPTAAACALSGAGFGGGGFTFLGFMPRKPGKILKMVKAALALEKPVIIYESPYRIVKLLEIIKAGIGPDLRAAAARELSKTFEEYIIGTVSEVAENLSARKKILGEFVLILAPSGAENLTEEDNEED
ncbi:MAG: 16S rRNA (cytidine(1402)-2'-O)-methyltransferase [Elusimicrobiaceae bacterium]